MISHEARYIAWVVESVIFSWSIKIAKNIDQQKNVFFRVFDEKHEIVLIKCDKSFKLTHSRFQRYVNLMRTKFFSLRLHENHFKNSLQITIISILNLFLIFINISFCYHVFVKELQRKYDVNLFTSFYLNFRKLLEMWRYWFIHCFYKTLRLFQLFKCILYRYLDIIQCCIIFINFIDKIALKLSNDLLVYRWSRTMNQKILWLSSNHSTRKDNTKCQVSTWNVFRKRNNFRDSWDYLHWREKARNQNFSICCASDEKFWLQCTSFHEKMQNHENEFFRIEYLIFSAIFLTIEFAIDRFIKYAFLYFITFQY